MAEVQLTGKIIKGKREVIYTVIEVGEECILVPLNGGKNSIETNPISDRVRPEEPPVKVASSALLESIVSGSIAVVGHTVVRDTKPAVV